MSACWLCGPSDDELWRGKHWRILLNHNQDKLGKLMLGLLRHEEDVTRLHDDEIGELWPVLRRAKRAVDELFAPDRWNYAFLMNLDRHAHLHAIPRYVGHRSFAALDFEDRDEERQVRLPPAARGELHALRAHLRG